MPGAYAHITLVNVAREPARCEAAGIPGPAIRALGKHLKFCELGAVSPDYPYLVLGDSDANHWADVMHYERTGEVIHAGIRVLRGMKGEAASKGLAWLFGFAAHVTTDVTIHPVVQKKVGPYAQNKTAHRLCEMNQDVHIYRRFGIGNIGEAQHLRSGIATCASSADRHRLDEDVATLWGEMLRQVHGGEAARNPPNLDRWHKAFVLVLDRVADEGHHLIPFARHVADGQGLTYPETVDPQYIAGLETPDGKRLDYDAIFDQAIGNVTRVWRDVANGVLEGRQDHVASIRNWNLDTGADAEGKLAFWGVA